MTALAARLRRHRQEPVLINGEKIKFRRIQLWAWGGVVAACGAALVAGGYFNLLQVNWHVHIGDYSRQFFYLKHWWDGGLGHRVRTAAWPLYRHGLRDIGEPALATLWVKTVLAQRKTWNKRAGPVYLIAAPFLLVFAAVVLIIGGIWVLDFGLPNLWHGAFGTYRIVEPGLVQGIWSAGATVLIGILIGLVIHRIWAPAGATIQGYWVDRAVDRSRLTGDVPLWVRYPLAPVQVRERWAVMMEDDENTISDRAYKHRWQKIAFRTAMVATMVIVAYLVVTGFIAHFWVGAGHSFPYLAP